MSGGIALMPIIGIALVALIVVAALVHFLSSRG